MTVAPAARLPAPGQDTVSVVVCTFSEGRWGLLCDALDSLEEQSHLPDEIVVVVDHNQPLLERIATRFAEVRAVASDAALRGPGGIRNTA